MFSKICIGAARAEHRVLGLNQSCFENTSGNAADLITVSFGLCDASVTVIAGYACRCCGVAHSFGWPGSHRNKSGQA